MSNPPEGWGWRGLWVMEVANLFIFKLKNERLRRRRRRRMRDGNSLI